MTTISDMFAQITDLMARDAGFFITVGTQEYSAFAVIIVVWFGIQWALSGGMQMDRFVNMLLKLTFGYAMIHYYTTPLFAGYDFHHLITEEGRYLANLLNYATTDSLFAQLNNLIKNTQSPGMFGIADVAAWLQFFLLIGGCWAAEGATYLVIAWGYIAQAVCILLGPVLIPFFLIPELDWMFYGWLKAFVQYSFYPVVANAVVFVLGRLLINSLAPNLQPSGADQWAMLGPMLIMMSVFVFGVLKVPQLCNDIFTGRSGSSVIPKF